MKSKADIKRVAMKNAVRLWGLKSTDQLDPVIRLLIEVFASLNYDLTNSVEDIKERLLEQISQVLTPDNLIAVKPAHSILKVMPVEPQLIIDRTNCFYTDYLTKKAIEYELKTINFSPVLDQVKLIKGEIKSLLCERNLFSIGFDGEKELLTKANSFYQDINRTVYIGFDLDQKISNLKDIHFYFDFTNTPHRHQLYDLLQHTQWSMDGIPINTESGIAEAGISEKRPGGIFAHYNTLQLNDEEIMDLYRKQFLYIRDSIRTKTLKKHPFPPELIPYFPERVKEQEPQYWLKILFPPYFKKEDLEDLSVFLNAFPVSNKRISNHTSSRSNNITDILSLPILAGEYFLAVENLEDSFGYQYKFLPYSSTESTLGGTYTIKRGGKERFSTRDLKDLFEKMIDLMRTELSAFTLLKLDNISNSVTEMQQLMNGIKQKLDHNNSAIKEVTTYLLIDPNLENKDNDIDASYWITNCDLANNIPYGTQLNPLKTLPIEKDSCYLLKATTGGRTIAKDSERLTAYKYALTTRNQLFSARDIENYCYMKYSEKVASIKVTRGVAAGIKQSQGLIRTVDVLITPTDEYRELFDATTQGELKLELEKRSPTMYNYRILIQ